MMSKELLYYVGLGDDSQLEITAIASDMDLITVSHDYIKCSIFESVKTKYMNELLGYGYRMLVDEDGHYKNLKLNSIASYLYDKKSIDAGVPFQPILGKVLFVKDVMTDEGPDFTGMSKDEADELILKIKMAMVLLSGALEV